MGNELNFMQNFQSAAQFTLVLASLAFSQVAQLMIRTIMELGVAYIEMALHASFNSIALNLAQIKHSLDIVRKREQKRIDVSSLLSDNQSQFMPSSKKS
ncbi:hypothetical protein J6590_027868 [Homalodisca vitripennis]|nr:hypothetical protein J6590_027868 [Homalodisca vitripennis]